MGLGEVVADHVKCGQGAEGVSGEEYVDLCDIHRLVC